MRTNPLKCPSYVSICVKTKQGKEAEKELTGSKSHLCQNLCQTYLKSPYNVYT